MSKSQLQTAQEELHFAEAFKYSSRIHINGHGVTNIAWVQTPGSNLFVADYGSLPMHDFRADELYRKFLLVHQAVRTDRRGLSYNGSPIEAKSDGPSRLVISKEAILKKYEEDIKAATAFLAEKGAQLLNEYKEAKITPPAYLEKNKIEGHKDLFACINAKEFIRFYAQYSQEKEEKKPLGKRL